MHHDWLPVDDDANTCHREYYLPTPEEIRAKTLAIRNGELFIKPDGIAVTGREAKELHKLNQNNTKKRVKPRSPVVLATPKVQSKCCSCCRRVLAVDSFHRKTKSVDGLQNKCRDCRHQESMARKRVRNQARQAVA